ncbi:MAG: 2-oxoacid:acceptor oxidoreductase subunit alpha [Candidatus Hodarchaeales archaeon]
MDQIQEFELGDRSSPLKPVKTLQKVTIRLAGDSGDGMQLAGSKFTSASVILGNDVSTLPDFPAEIRAPAGTLAGVSGFQIQFADTVVYTPGDALDALVVMNPAALKANISDLKKGGILIANLDAFTKNNLKKVGYQTNPLTDNSLDGYQVYSVKMTTLHQNAVSDIGLTKKQVNLSKNFFALGLISWLYDRPLTPTIQWVQEKFVRNQKLVDANIKTLKAGYYYGETTEIFHIQYRVPPAKMKPGIYKRISGNEALALGIIAASELSSKPAFYSGYPITPASDILHELSKHKSFGVRTFQAEDEIAAIGAAIGASFGGSFAITATSGPGIALKGEGLGLILILELPLLVINVQRAGPSTGMPTKPEQSDLLQAMFGRNGESPLPILAPNSPADCFDTVIEAVRIAFKYMTPVMFLSDGYLANSSDPWLIPDLANYDRFPVKHPSPDESEDFFPYHRDENLSRPWAIPGTKNLEHRIGGLEKKEGDGDVSYDPVNHQRMVNIRQEKINNIAFDIPPLQVEGPETGDLLIIGWGSTYGAIKSAASSLRNQGYSVANTHLRYLNPFPSNLGKILNSYEKIVVPEMNMGQLLLLIRAKYLVGAIGLNKVEGKPFHVADIENKIREILGVL